MSSKEVKVIIGVTSLLLPSLAGCATAKDGSPTPVITEEAPSPPPVGVQEVSTPEIIKWSLGSLEEKWKITFPDDQADIHAISFYSPPDREFVVTNQAEELISFILRFRDPARPLPEPSFQIMFTDAEPPEGKTFYGWTEGNRSVVSLGKLEKTPPLPQEEAPFSTQVSMVFAAGLCPLLDLQPSDFSEELQYEDEAQVWTSFGFMVASAIQGFSYERYMQRTVYTHPDTEGQRRTILFPRGIYDEMREMLEDKPPINISESSQQ